MAKIDWQYTEGTISNVMAAYTYGRAGNVYVVTFTYKVDGHYYGGEFNAGTALNYSEGGSIRVGYNPANPEENNLDGKGLSVWWYRLAGPAIIVIYILIHGCRK